MSSFVKASGGITPNSADPGEEFPFLHTITVVDRVVSVDKPELVQNNIKTETVTLNLDSEWEGLSTVINLGNERPVSVIWSGEPVVIPAELMTTVGSLDVSVVGYGNDGGIRAVTKQAQRIFNVVASGFVEGDEAAPDPTTLLGQLIQAADNANQAADRFNQASDDIEGIGPAIEKVQASEANAKQSETNAAASAESASQSASTASTSAEAARTSETNAASSATAAQQAVDGFGLEVGTTTTGEPGTDAAVEIQKNGTKYTANFTIPRGEKGEKGDVPSLSRTMADPESQRWNAIDFNGFTEDGVYTFNGEPTNSPRGDTSWITGTLIVVHSIQNIMQLCAYAPSTHNAGFAFRNGNIFSDTSNITWHKWHEIAFLDDLPDASALADEMGDIASLSTRVQALEARVKSLETN